MGHGLTMWEMMDFLEQFDLYKTIIYVYFFSSLMPLPLSWCTCSPSFKFIRIFPLISIPWQPGSLGRLWHHTQSCKSRCRYYVQTYKAFAHIQLMVECKSDQERKVSMSHKCSKLAFVVAFVVWSSHIPMTKVFCFKTICSLGDNIQIHWVLTLNFFELCVEEAFRICIFSSGT